MRGLALVLLTCLCAGCANMHVQVDIVNPAYVEAHKDQLGDWARLNLVLNQPPPTIQKIMEADRDALFALYGKVANSYLLLAQKPGVNPTDKANLTGAAQSLNVTSQNYFTATYFMPILNDLTVFYQQISDAVARLPKDAQAAVLNNERLEPDNIRALVNERMLRVQHYVEVVEAEMRSKAAEAEKLQISEADKQPAREAQTDIKQVQDQTLKSLLGTSGSVADSPLAYVVANAPDSAWKKQFNETLVKGNFGNVSTAIKLENLADFTIKGMTFDPNKVAQVAAKVTTQSLLVAAQIAGVPVNGQAQSSDSGQALVQASSTLADAQKKLDSQRAINRDYRSALIDVGHAILREKEGINEAAVAGGPDAPEAKSNRASAIAAINASFEAQKKRLTVSQPAPPQAAVPAAAPTPPANP
jgi:hypothetical protein